MEYQALTPEDKAYPIKVKERMGKEAPVIYYNGPLKLLDRFCMAVLCSDLIPGQCMIEANQLLFTIREYAMNYIGGWHSVMETEIFRLAMNRPTDPDNLRSLTMSTAHSMARETWDNFLADRFGYSGPFTGFPQKQEYYRRAEEGKLLVMSITEPTLKRLLRKNIMLRNLLVCALADVVFVPFAEKGSKTLTTCARALDLNVPMFTVNHEENRVVLNLGVPAYSRKTVGKFLDSLGASRNGAPPFPPKQVIRESRSSLQGYPKKNTQIPLL